MIASEETINQIAKIVERGEYSVYGIRFGWANTINAGDQIPNSWHPADFVADCTDGERNEALELNGACGFTINDCDDVEQALRTAYAEGFGDDQYAQIVLIGAAGKNDGEILETGEVFGLPEQGAACFEGATAIAVF